MHTDGRTAGQTDKMKIKVAFCRFSSAHKTNFMAAGKHSLEASDISCNETPLQYSQTPTTELYS
jgi:hypothetical protein